MAAPKNPDLAHRMRPPDVGHVATPSHAAADQDSLAFRTLVGHVFFSPAILVIPMFSSDSDD